MFGTPFIIFYVVGIILGVEMYYILKLAILMCIYLVVYGISRILFDDRLMTVMPMAVYLATKVIVAVFLLFTVYSS